MNDNTITAISPLDGRYHGKLASLRDIFSEYGLLKWRVMVEVAWLKQLFTVLPDIGTVAAEQVAALEKIVADFSYTEALKVKSIEEVTKHDIKAIEYFIKSKLPNNLINKLELIHFACTSEDINNLAYGLMLDEARQHCLLPILEKILDKLSEMASEHADLGMLARTHGQPASPTTLGKELAIFFNRIKEQYDNLVNAKITGKFNGASGNYNTLVFAYPNIEWQAISQAFVSSLGLTWNSHTTQSEPHDCLVTIFNLVAHINNILLDLVRDMWGYIALGYLQQLINHHEVGSSTMPHKVNPIDFEHAEGNLGVANALLNHMSNKLPISRWQRDLSDSTVMRNIGVALGHSLISYQAILRGLDKIIPNKSLIAEDLNNHWEVLAEPIQTMMRLYNIDLPYEKLKALTRGATITPEVLHAFINDQDLPATVKAKLLALTPETYLGYANILAHNVLTSRQLDDN